VCVWWRPFAIFASCSRGESLGSSQTTSHWWAPSAGGQIRGRAVSSTTSPTVQSFCLPFVHIFRQSDIVVDILSWPADDFSMPPPPLQQASGCFATCGSPAPSASSLVDLLEVAAAQATYLDCQRASTSSSLQVSAVKMQNTSILVDSSSGIFRPVLPAISHRAIFDTSTIWPIQEPGPLDS
jgi:hypothetical protein